MSACSPLVIGDLVFAVTSNGVDEGHVSIPAPKAPSFIAVEKRSGKLVWEDDSPTREWKALPPGIVNQPLFLKLVNGGRIVAHGQWSNPVYADVAGQEQVIFPGGNGWLRALDPKTGRLLWKFDCNPNNAAFALAGKGERNEIVGTPVVHEGRLYLGVGQDPEHETGVGHLWCIDLVKATAKGKTNPGQDVSPRANNFDPNANVNRDSALAWHFGGPTPKNVAQMMGRTYYFGRTMSTCAVADGLVYAAELGGYLHCLDARTGEHYWTHDTKSMCWSSPYCVDGKVYFGNDDGTMTVIAHGKKLEVLAELEMPGSLRTTPVAANGTLFVATENQLYAIAKDR
jgi:outer membrane protein assembly factor BamB